MPEIKEWDFILADEGWDFSEGKSHNVWGTVPFPEELLNYINENKDRLFILYDAISGEKKIAHNNRTSVWTAYDEHIYKKYGKVLKRELPRISATFKSCFTPYSAAFENIGMKIAMAMNMPTSYNYIVKFSPEDCPAIINNYTNPELKNKLMPYGIISIDFLQNKEIEPIYQKTTRKNKNGEWEELEEIISISGDKLIPFATAVQRYRSSPESADDDKNLIENWINSVDRLAKKELQGCPREDINKKISKVHSRIIRSFLLREFLGDCDYTAYNSGIVLNEGTMQLRFAPNHDFGECFNALIKNFFAPENPNEVYGMPKHVFESLPEQVKTTVMQTYKPKPKLPITEIATQWASSTSERNFYYALENFPEASAEFFESLDHIAQSGAIEQIIDEFAEITYNGEPLLKEQEREALKTYLEYRLTFMCELYVKFLESHKQKPHSTVIERNKHEDYHEFA